MVLVVTLFLFTVGLSGCQQKLSREKNAEDTLLDSFVGTWKTFQHNDQEYTYIPSRMNYFNDSITITFFSDRTLSWDIEETWIIRDTTDPGQNQEQFKEYTYPGYYKMLAGKLVITSYGVGFYNYIFSNNSQNLTLTPIFDVPDAIQWRRNQTMILIKSKEQNQQSVEEQNTASNTSREFYGTWMTQITGEVNDGSQINRYNDSVLITFFSNGFFSWVMNRTGNFQWISVYSSEWHSYNETYTFNGYYEIKGKKLVLTALGVGIFIFFFSNNSLTLTLTPIYCKNLLLHDFPVEFYAQTLILKKQSESYQQNSEEKNPDENVSRFVGAWKTSKTANDSSYFIIYNDTLTLYSEGFVILMINTTIISEKDRQNWSQKYQGYYDLKSGKFVITATSVFISNFSFSNDSSTLILTPLFKEHHSFLGFDSERILLTKK